jgi:stringent starvation protein B
MNALDTTSTRPYLIRALYEWCTDNSLTPYVAVMVDDTVQVPREYVKNNEIVLNISFDATSSLKLGNDFIEFKARFAGSAREILVPISRVIAIYARENGQGMAFPAPTAAGTSSPSVLGHGNALALASSGDTSGVAVDPKLMQLVPETDVTEQPHDASEPPEPPKSPPTKRPSLTRVK